ncbi:MAG: N-acetylgalactosamine 6-sulfate sulfatase [Planctomycetaceae bacterium]|nr:N-acetylgalactosamine 6-sulfate sulfatase [Planctomycetaceae bacterium]
MTVTLALVFFRLAPAEEKPNVILIITDDQGYGDVSAHGNPLLKTPNLDQLHAASVRLTNYHVDPTCSPTRSALLSGRYSTKTGVWHTICGRSLMAPEELTIAEILSAAGYQTGMFGKWHLGDAYPTRPQDQGFQSVVYHGGGGVGQTPDYFGNDYFDDTYWRQGQVEKFDGYCTDVWFREAQKFIHQHRQDPFFVYLSTNAPHGPFLVDEKYSAPYVEAGDGPSRFLGMIANIDENVGNLVAYLKEQQLWDNTIFIFTTDNGTAAGDKVFSAGMRGKKGSEYDGGHRVPFFIHWPKGGIEGGKDVDQLTAHIDLRPTLTELCDVLAIDGPVADGTSLVSILKGDQDRLRDRTLFVHSQRILHPEKWRKSAVMTDQWRLVNGEQLFDMRQDPQQSQNVAIEHPEVVGKLRQAYEGWWKSLEPSMERTVHIQIGSDAEPRTRLTAHDWLVQGSTPWHQNMVKSGAMKNGPWAIEVLESGEYEIVISRWPEHLERPIEAKHARLTIQGQELEEMLDPMQSSTRFRVKLQPGKTQLQTYLTGPDDRVRGAYYAYVRQL